MQLLRELLQRIAAGESKFEPSNDSDVEYDQFQKIANRLLEAKEQGYVHDLRAMKTSRRARLGIVRVFVIGGITFKGEQFLQSQDSVAIDLQNSPNEATDLDIFISHGSDDQDAAAAFIALIRSALNIDPKRIRCTSVDGFRLQAGDNFNDQLRRELLVSKAFIALLSSVSLRSTYVLFELGARWGSHKFFAPILIKGLTTSNIGQPLSSMHTIASSSESDILQFIENLGLRLRCRENSLSQYKAELQYFCSTFVSSASP